MIIFLVLFFSFTATQRVAGAENSTQELPLISRRCFIHGLPPLGTEIRVIGRVHRLCGGFHSPLITITKNTPQVNSFFYHLDVRIKSEHDNKRKSSPSMTIIIGRNTQERHFPFSFHLRDPETSSG